MIDLLYLVGTVAFFALMLAYVAFCRRLGQTSDADVGTSERRS